MRKRFIKNLKGQSVLVTGAGGFVGFHVVKKLIEKGAKVHALDSYFNPNLKNLEIEKFYKASLLDFGKLQEIVKKSNPVKIVHLGATVNLDRSFTIAKECIKNNIEGTVVLLESLKKTPFDVFVFLSTAEVYGSGNVPFKETQKEIPPSPYAISKLAAENFCQFYSKTYQYPITILRLSTSYGPAQNEKRMIPSSILSCLKKKSIRISCGKQKRDYVYIEDVAEGIVETLITPQAVNETFNLGSRKSVSVQEIVSEIKTILQSNSPILYGSVSKRANENIFWSSDSSKAKKILKWETQTSLHEGLLKTIRWYKQNYD